MPTQLLDTNVWLASTFSAHPANKVAKQFFGELSEKNQGAFCRSTQQSFLRLITTPTIYAFYGVERINNDLAIELLKVYQRLPSVTYAEEPPQLFDRWCRLSAIKSASPKVWMDAYLAAFAISNSMTFVSFDRDFKRFESDGLQLRLLG